MLEIFRYVLLRLEQIARVSESARVSETGQTGLGLRMQCYWCGIVRMEWCLQGLPTTLVSQGSSCSSRQHLKTASNKGECDWDSAVETAHKALGCLRNQVERGTGCLCNIIPSYTPSMPPDRDDFQKDDWWFFESFSKVG